MVYVGLDTFLPPLKKKANYGSDRSIHNFSTEFQPTASHFPPPVHTVAIYLSRASRPGQHSSHFKEMCGIISEK